MSTTPSTTSSTTASVPHSGDNFTPLFTFNRNLMAAYSAAVSTSTVLLTQILFTFIAWTARGWNITRRRVGNDDAMSTIEYALGCVAAAGLGALLYTVVTGDDVAEALSAIFTRALKTK